MLAEGGHIVAFLHRDCETAPVSANARAWIVVDMWTNDSYDCPSAQAYYPTVPMCAEPCVKVPPRPE